MSKNNENKLVPKLRFPEFAEEGEWNEKSFSQLFEFGNGKDYKHLSTGDIPVYGTGGKMLSVNDYLYDGESVCIGRKGTIDNPLFLTGKFWTVDTLFYTHSYVKSIPKFIYYVFLKIDWYNYNEAGGVPSLSKTTISKIKVLIPPVIDEQQKIAACLSSLDEIIKAESQKLDFLYSYKKGLLQNLFPQQGETVPKFRFKEFTESWKKVKLKDVSIYFNGGSYENEVKEEGKYELITLKSINTNGQLVSSKRYVDIEVPTLTKGTLVMILSEQAPGLLGMTAIIPTNNKYVLNQRVAEIRPNQKVESYFLSMAINRNQAYFSKHGAGMKVQNISKPNVEKYEFLIPDILEQQKIASTLSSIDDLILAQTQKIEALQLHKKGLLQGLFPSINNEEYDNNG